MLKTVDKLWEVAAPPRTRRGSSPDSLAGGEWVAAPPPLSAFGRPPMNNPWHAPVSHLYFTCLLTAVSDILYVIVPINNRKSN